MKTINILKNKKGILAIGLMLTFGSLFVQANSVIKGKLIDKNNKVIPYATATIIDPATMQIVKGDMTDDNGDFIITNVQPGKYVLTIRSVGYETIETKTIEVNPEALINTGKIVMNDAVFSLNEIVVKPAQNATPAISLLN